MVYRLERNATEIQASRILDDIIASKDNQTGILAKQVKMLAAESKESLKNLEPTTCHFVTKLAVQGSAMMATALAPLLAGGGMIYYKGSDMVDWLADSSGWIQGAVIFGVTGGAVYVLKKISENPLSAMIYWDIIKKMGNLSVRRFNDEEALLAEMRKNTFVKGLNEINALCAEYVAQLEQRFNDAKSSVAKMQEFKKALPKIVKEAKKAAEVMPKTAGVVPIDFKKLQKLVKEMQAYEITMSTTNNPHIPEANQYNYEVLCSSNPKDIFSKCLPPSLRTDLKMAKQGTIGWFHTVKATAHASAKFVVGAVGTAVAESAFAAFAAGAAYIFTPERLTQVQECYNNTNTCQKGLLALAAAGVPVVLVGAYQAKDVVNNYFAEAEDYQKRAVRAKLEADKEVRDMYFGIAEVLEHRCDMTKPKEFAVLKHDAAGIEAILPACLNSLESAHVSQQTVESIRARFEEVIGAIKTKTSQAAA